MEIAVAVAILVAAATFVRTVGALMLVEIGPNNDGAIVVEVSLPRASYATTTQVQRFYDHLDDELRALAGVQATGATNHLPGSSTLLALSQPMTLENLGLSRTSVAGNALRLAATPGYFRAIGIDVLAGRAFTDVDREGTARTAIVSERYARAFGLEPPDIVGLRVNVGVGDEQWAEVVGVVRDVRMRGPESDLQPAVYTPFAQTPVNLTGFVVVRTAPGFRDPSSRLRSAVDRIDPTLPLYNLRTFGQVQSEYLAARRFTMIALVSLASVAASLASLGLYGILSYLVRLRTREIGVRIALGATSAMLHRDVIAGGVRHAVAGIGLGLALALGLWRVVSAHVPGMEQLDTLSVTIVCSVVFVLSICAAWLPARRAASVDPLVALRAD
jgi:predicted permease